MSRKTPPTFVKFGNPFGNPASVASLIRKGMMEVAVYDRQGRIYASASAYCPRQTMLSATMSSTEIQSAAAQGYMRIGSAIEDIVCDALYKTEALLFKQYKLPDIGVNMGGYIDAIVIAESKIKILEIKSCGKLPVEPKLGHRMQATMYGAVTGIPASVLYFSRNVADYEGELQIREFPLNNTREEQLLALYNVSLAHFAITDGVVPGIPTGWNQGNCQYCPFIPYCWEDSKLPFFEATPKQSKNLIAKAREKANELMDAKNVADRRTGIINFIQHNGTNHAEALLKSSDWSRFF